jgi:hypothetical protein
MTKDKKKQRLQRFLIVSLNASGKPRVIGTNGGLPFVSAAATKHATRLTERDKIPHEVVEITKLTKA